MPNFQKEKKKKKWVHCVSRYGTIRLQLSTVLHIRLRLQFIRLQTIQLSLQGQIYYMHTSIFYCGKTHVLTDCST